MKEERKGSQTKKMKNQKCDKGTSKNRLTEDINANTIAQLPPVIADVTAVLQSAIFLCDITNRQSPIAMVNSTTRQRVLHVTIRCPPVESRLQL